MSNSTMTDPHDLMAFVTIIGSVGAWIGSSTVQHLTGLTLTQPFLSWLGPISIVGSFGIYQAGLKAVMTPSQLRAFGWSADQTPARGVAEALTTGPTESDSIHFGFPVQRQQSHLVADQAPLDDGPRQQQGAGRAVESFPVRAKSGNVLVKSPAISNGDNVGPHVYHSNVSWLGSRRGALVSCSDKDSFNARLAVSCVTTCFLSYIAITVVLYGEINLLGPGRRGAVVAQVLCYGITKALLVMAVHVRFLLRAIVYMPGRPCGEGGCLPARLRIYKQSFSDASNGTSATSFVYCERAYRLVQGIAHPALRSRDSKGRPYYKSSGADDDAMPTACHMRWRQAAMYAMDFAVAILSMVHLFFYAWYLAWLSTNVVRHESKPRRVYGWIVGELALLGLKVAILANKSITWPMEHGRPINLVFRSDFAVTNDDMMTGRLREVSHDHVILFGAQTKYDAPEPLTTMHVRYDGNESRVEVAPFFVQQIEDAQRKRTYAGSWARWTLRYEPKAYSLICYISTESCDVVEIPLEEPWREANVRNSFNVAWKRASRTPDGAQELAPDEIWVGHRDFFSKRGARTTTEATYERTITLTLTRVTTLTSKSIVVLETHTAQERLPGAGAPWLKLNPNLSKGCIRVDGRDIGVHFLGASKYTGMLLSNRSVAGQSMPNCFCEVAAAGRF